MFGLPETYSSITIESVIPRRMRWALFFMFITRV